MSIKLYISLRAENSFGALHNFFQLRRWLEFVVVCIRSTPTTKLYVQICVSVVNVSGIGFFINNSLNISNIVKYTSVICTNQNKSSPDPVIKAHSGLLCKPYNLKYQQIKCLNTFGQNKLIIITEFWNLSRNFQLLIIISLHYSSL